MSQNRKSSVIIIDREPGLPYSKGLMASRVMATGLSAYRSYQVAEKVEDVLIERGDPTVTSEELGRVAVEVLREVAGDRYAQNYVRWQQVEKLDVPLVILIGGATGVGKSTIASHLATRLGIVRVVATDAVREVMRAMFSDELMPSLHTSSFQAGSMLREYGLEGADRVIAGFREQTAAVSVGLNAFLERAALEGTSVIIEGAHMVPGFIDIESTKERVLAIPLVVTVEDEDVHRVHFMVRGTDVASRPTSRYAKGFDNIRRIQKFIRSQALSHGVPIIPNYSLDQSIAAVLELVVERATQLPPKGDGDRSGSGSVGDAALAEPAPEVTATNGHGTNEESTGDESARESTGSAT